MKSADNSFDKHRLFGQRLAALALAVDVAFQLPVAQLGLHLCGPASRIRPYSRARVAPHRQVIHRLAVVLCCVADVIAPLPGLCVRSTFTWFLVP